MSDRYEQPGYNSYIDDWHTPLNRNFSDIGDDIEALEAGKAGLDGAGTASLTNYASIDAGAVNNTIHVSASEGGAGISSAVAPGAHIVLEPNAVYDVSTPLGLADNLTIEAPSSTTLRATGDNAIISHDGTSTDGGILLRNLTLDGDVSTTGNTSGLFYCEDLTGITLENMWAINSNGGTGFNFTRCANIDFNGGGAESIGETGTGNGSGISTVACSGRIRGATVRDCIFGFNIQNQRSWVQGEAQQRMVVANCDALFNNRGSIGSGFRASGTGSSTPSRGFTFIGCMEIESEQYGFLLYGNVHDSMVIGCTSVGAGTQAFYDHGDESGGGEGSAHPNVGNEWISNTAIVPQDSGFRTHHTRQSVCRDLTVVPTHHNYTHTTAKAIHSGTNVVNPVVEGCTFHDPGAYLTGVLSGEDAGAVRAADNIGLDSHGRWGDQTPTVFTKTTSSSGSVSYLLDGTTQLREAGQSTTAADTLVYNNSLAIDPTQPRRMRLDVGNISANNASSAVILVELTSDPGGLMLSGTDYVSARIRGDGTVESHTSSGGTAASTIDSTMDNAFVTGLEYIELRWNGTDLHVKVSDDKTTPSRSVGVTEGTNYPTSNLFLKIHARDSSGSTQQPVNVDVTDIRFVDA